MTRNKLDELLTFGYEPRPSTPVISVDRMIALNSTDSPRVNGYWRGHWFDAMPWETIADED